MPAGLLLALLITALPDDSWLLARFEEGDLDTIQAVHPSLPAGSAAASFFEAVFTIDGQAAARQYETLLANHPESPFTVPALTRLRQYAEASRDSSAVLRWQGFLEMRTNSTPIPPPANSPPVVAVKPITLPTPVTAPTAVEAEPPAKAFLWTVQVGAFKSKKAAESTGKRVARFGKVVYAKKDTNGSILIAVQIGSFELKPDAERLAQEVASSTGLQGVVVRK